MTQLPNLGFPDWKGVMWGDVRSRAGNPSPPIPYARTGREVEASLKRPLHSRPVATWYSVGVPPGKKQEGFSFVSARLPGIVPCYARGAQFTSIFYGGETEAMGRLMHQNSRLFLYGKTVGPVLESPPKDPAKTLKQLREWLVESQELGWINDGDLAARLSSMLEATRGYWQDGSETSARQELVEIIAVAEEERDTGITSELYAILKFNAEALLASIDLSSGK